jgi:hypothetical protein
MLKWYVKSSFNTLKLVVMKSSKGVILNVTDVYTQVCHVSCVILRYEMLKHEYEMLVPK